MYGAAGDINLVRSAPDLPSSNIAEKPVLNLEQFSSAKWISWKQWKALPHNFLSIKVIFR